SVFLLAISSADGQDNPAMATNKQAMEVADRPAPNMKQATMLSPSLSQLISVKITDKTLKEALEHITQKAGLKLSYSDQQVPLGKEVSLNAQSITVNRALWKVLEGTGLRFGLSPNKNLVLMKREQVKQEIAQETVKGTVTDAESGQVLPGVNIIVKGTTTGTSTDGQGKFELQVPSLQDTLVFSFIGYERQEVSINGRTELSVELQNKAITGEELVVVGYGTQRKEEVTSAVSKVTADDFNEGGVQSPIDLVQGKVAGLTLTRTAGSNPNAGTAIQLRGVTSINGNIEPLIVVDGIPGGNMDLLQPSDIASIDVLKDGSAAAIYGTRGNNGVILITTKKGQGGEARFSYSTYFRHEAVAKKPEYLTASEYRSLIDKGIIGEGNDKGHTTDLYDALINKNNLSQYHNFAVSGGNDKTNYRASFYFDDKYGIAKENSRSEYGGRININHKGLDNRLQLNTNIA